MNADRDPTLKPPDHERLPASKAPTSVAFVHDFLDSYGLDPYEFRVYCHIVRRTGGKPEGVCFASLERMAKDCKISERKIQQVLKFLIQAQMITQNKHLGRKTDEYRVTLSQEWVPSKQLDGLRSRSKKGKGKQSALGDDSVPF
jgi:predicted transcriptional regulator